MRPFQRLKDNNNIEVVLFPFENMYITQDEGGSYSHTNTYNMDFMGWNGSRIYHCPFYAPVTLKCVAIWDASNNNRVYESVNPVHLADGSIDYLTIAFAHDETPVHNVGDIIQQGNLLGHTGEYGQTEGDHTHSCCGKGRYVGYTERSTGQWDLTNRMHYWNATFINDTVIYRSMSHNWVEYSGPTPITPTKSRFKFYLYANKLRRNYKNKKVKQF